MTPDFESNIERELAILDKKYEISNLKLEAYFNQYKKIDEGNAYACLVESSYDNLRQYMKDTTTVLESSFASKALANYMAQNNDRVHVKYDFDAINKNYADSIVKGEGLIKDIEHGVEVDAINSSDNLLMKITNFIKGPGIKMAQKEMSIRSFKKSIHYVDDQAKKVDELKKSYSKKKDKLTPKQSKSIMDVIETLYKNTKHVVSLYKSAQQDLAREAEEKSKKEYKEYKKNLPKAVKKIKI